MVDDVVKANFNCQLQQLHAWTPSARARFLSISLRAPFLGMLRSIISTNQVDSAAHDIYGVQIVTWSERTRSMEVVITANGNHICATIRTGFLAASSEKHEQFLHLLSVFFARGQHGLAEESFEDWLLWSPACASEFRSLRPPSIAIAGQTNFTMQDYLDTPTLFYEIHATSHHALTPVKKPAPMIWDDNPHPAFGIKLDNTLCSNVACYRPSQIHFDSSCFASVVASFPRKVYKENDPTTLFFYKPCVTWPNNHAEAELQRYIQIGKAGLPADLAICRLHGIVRNVAGTVFGLLLTNVEGDPHPTTLRSAFRSMLRANRALRQRWVDDITNIVATLHAAGIVWGDAKPDNVLVDKNNKVWIIDFGGGYTPGWVEKEVAETVAGDMQGLSNIKSFLLEAT